MAATRNAASPYLVPFRPSCNSHAGALRAARGEVPYFAHLRAVTFDVPATAAQEIKFWAHLLTPAGSSEAMPATLELANGSAHTSLDLQLFGGQVVLPLAAACRLSLQLPR